MHSYDKDSVIIFTAPGRVLFISRDGKEEMFNASIGDVLFRKGGEPYSEEVLSGFPRAFIVELK